MAASMRRLTYCCLRFQQQNSQILSAHVQSVIQRARSVSSDGNDNSNRKFRVGLSADESTVICWHPEPKFPYEHTKPLPRKESELREGDSVLKVQHLRDFRFRHRPDGPTIQELSNMFFTSKHRWFPNKQKRYRKPKIEKDREGL